MEHLDWIKNTSQFDKVQKTIEADCSYFIEHYFNENNDYAIEKFLKVYTEGLRSMEQLLLHKYNCDSENLSNPSKFYHNHVDKESYLKKLEEIELIMTSEAKRQRRHIEIFLGEISINDIKEERKKFNFMEQAVKMILEPQKARQIYAFFHKKLKENRD